MNGKTAQGTSQPGGENNSAPGGAAGIRTPSRSHGQEIPREKWAEFLNLFSRNHRGWTARLSVGAERDQPNIEIRSLPLDGVTLTSNTPEDGGVVVMLGERGDDHVAHTIGRVKKILCHQEERHLELESESGEVTSLEWSAPPEM